MGKELFSEIGIIRAADLEEGPITPGQIRRKALEVGELWVGECHVTALDQPSQWHHHNDFDSVMYMLSGRIRVDHGPGGKQSFELGAGDYAYFPRRMIHRAQMLQGGDDVRYVFVRIGQGETLENVAGPEA
ncbi:cupin domain-containing protein [Martelella soudanensis]|uniref:cupin domain-containing protein n=1 Tax=unclassified Martelella TaxID=2629616 RepID=UPI0015DDEE9C|nr:MULTISPECIES: cupin domain-containing protein [unclassified Martelella]